MTIEFDGKDVTHITHLSSDLTGPLLMVDLNPIAPGGILAKVTGGDNVTTFSRTAVTQPWSGRTSATADAINADPTCQRFGIRWKPYPARAEAPAARTGQAVRPRRLHRAA